MLISLDICLESRFGLGIHLFVPEVFFFRSDQQELGPASSPRELTRTTVLETCAGELIQTTVLETSWLSSGGGDEVSEAMCGFHPDHFPSQRPDEVLRPENPYAHDEWPEGS
ncbi:hypothetical protein PAPYR_8511 [Paratrimastix pyriformis]|uniref:Uncharacterized protein n=1 Tax=Paratrimastix pyriformis TaxID=342808 RepID=A0ABQ8UC17_9EUKA|nr:hypothetical protein PAPYR_8511 [Paratrimastix pyriformis]